MHVNVVPDNENAVTEQKHPYLSFFSLVIKDHQTM